MNTSLHKVNLLLVQLLVLHVTVVNKSSLPIKGVSLLLRNYLAFGKVVDEPNLSLSHSLCNTNSRNKNQHINLLGSLI